MGKDRSIGGGDDNNRAASAGSVGLPRQGNYSMGQLRPHGHPIKKKAPATTMVGLDEHPHRIRACPARNEARRGTYAALEAKTDRASSCSDTALLDGSCNCI